MKFLPSIESMLREAGSDTKFREYLDALSHKKTHINLNGMTETQKAYLIAATVLFASEEDEELPVPLILVSDELRARQMKSYLDAFFEKETVILRGRETHMTAVSASSREIEQGRVRALIKYGTRQCGALIVTGGALLTKMLPMQTLLRTSIPLRVGRTVEMEDLAILLSSMGYIHTREVSGVGEFTRRGGILDVFSPAGERPIRAATRATGPSRHGLNIVSVFFIFYPFAVFGKLCVAFLAATRDSLQNVDTARQVRFVNFLTFYECQLRTEIEKLSSSAKLDD